MEYSDYHSCNVGVVWLEAGKTGLTMDLPDNIAFNSRVQSMSVWFRTYNTQSGEMLYYHIVLSPACQGTHAAETGTSIRAQVQCYQVNREA